MELMVTVSCCLGLLTHWMTLVAAAGSEVTCYSYSSELDDSCIDDLTSTVICSLTQSKGCATKLTTNEAVVRGCADIGLTLQECQVSIVFDTECVCHTDRHDLLCILYNLTAAVSTVATLEWLPKGFVELPRFEMPINLEILSELTPVDYLAKYCVITSRVKKLLYHRQYTKNKDIKADGIDSLETRTPAHFYGH
ncbi:hypothetical protein EB796_015666 [Bugula neritina]|uniref:Uncharacterized protein n=1 Tax=Bugula neritina TaxID=10212 RepID=A0A7J7JIU4_BUGNE|nr:hypothetical protein EB796_015666 [Bugula neritina]